MTLPRIITFEADLAEVQRTIAALFATTETGAES